jgi:hypothetical protein
MDQYSDDAQDPHFNHNQYADDRHHSEN